ncbi:hypothetical protein YTPLAS72_03160 [Nitrospira sp.]|nr:hypothetical protein YTPLAS72_03160 [Nitrospira sp.]
MSIHDNWLLRPTQGQLCGAKIQVDPIGLVLVKYDSTQGTSGALVYWSDLVSLNLLTDRFLLREGRPSQTPLRLTMSEIYGTPSSHYTTAGEEADEDTYICEYDAVLLCNACVCQSG